MKENVKDTTKAGLIHAQGTVETIKETMLGSDKPDIKPEEIPTNARYDPNFKRGKL